MLNIIAATTAAIMNNFPAGFNLSVIVFDFIGLKICFGFVRTWIGLSAASLQFYTCCDAPFNCANSIWLFLESF
jgi:hypothetical protein